MERPALSVGQLSLSFAHDTFGLPCPSTPLEAGAVLNRLAARMLPTALDVDAATWTSSWTWAAFNPCPGVPSACFTILPAPRGGNRRLSLFWLLSRGRISPLPSPRPCSPRRVSRPGPACGEPVTLPFTSPLGTPPGRTWGGGGAGASLLSSLSKSDVYGLRGPLQDPPPKQTEEAAGAYLDFFQGKDFTKENVAEAAQQGSSLLEVAGGWKEALRAIRRHWVQTHGDHLAGLHSDFFEGLVHPAILERARHVAVLGVSAEADLEETQRVQSAPHPSLKKHIEEAAKQLWEDAAKGRSLLCYDKGEGLEGVISVPMARVLKMHPDRSISEKGRIIWDATPINKYCRKTRHPPALQPRHQEVARAILWWRLRFPRIRILLSKKDVAEAFKWIPIKLEDAKLFAADVPAEFTQTPEGTTLIYSFLTFGWCGAPGEYMHFAWVIKSAHGSFAPDNHRWEDDVPFHSLVLMDDTVLIEPELGFRPQLSVALSEYVTKATLGEGSINAAKDALEGRLECRKLIWGLVYDTQTYTRSLPAAKLEKAYHLLHLPDFDSGCTHVPLRLVQELRGNQQFWLAVLPGLSPYLGATNDLLGPADERGFAKPRGTATQQKAIWARFWESIELQRLLVDATSKWEVRFTHPLTSALTVRELLSFPGMSQKVVWASGDATPHKLAAVDWEANVAVVEPAESVWERLRRFCAEHDPELAAAEEETPPVIEARSEPGDGLMISLAELLAVVSLACLRWKSWEGKIVIYAGDNSNVISWLAKRHAGPPAARFLLQLLAALETVGGFRLHAEYISGPITIKSRTLSRGRKKGQFYQLGTWNERILRSPPCHAGQGMDPSGPAMGWNGP